MGNPLTSTSARTEFTQAVRKPRSQTRTDVLARDIVGMSVLRAADCKHALTCPLVRSMAEVKRTVSTLPESNLAHTSKMDKRRRRSKQIHIFTVDSLFISSVAWSSTEVPLTGHRAHIMAPVSGNADDEDGDMENVVLMDRQEPGRLEGTRHSNPGGIVGWWQSFTASRAGFSRIEDLEGGYDDTPMSRPIGALTACCSPAPSCIQAVLAYHIPSRYFG